MTAELSDSSCDFANRAQTLAALELKSHEKNSLVNGDVKLCEMSTENEWEQKKILRQMHNLCQKGDLRMKSGEIWRCMSGPCETLNEGASIYKRNRCKQFDLLHLLVFFLYFQLSGTFVLLLGFCLNF